ncbi:hypothetical protein WL200_11760 [Staphylococcus capitis]|uniref:hypothetical protein n=1 Tax=Staphylococcus capitis TaxID=29388 RepID=UPI0016426552|nr:hypothetical protein [Staphylococcus capitis]MBC3087782.1 hypothetical protein [Staphylococcus capitis]MCK6221699.1 hypothetical protein [Staphylococcus capitis]MCM3296510.1 hypothetical protein [Staphylococcus capitis]
MKWSKIIILILSLVPIEFIGLFTDYQTGLLIGYIPFIIVAILISTSIFKFGLKNNISIIISRCIGTFLSWVCVHLFMNIYDSSDYFKLLTTDMFALFLGVIHFIVIMLIYLAIYGFSHRNQ